MTKGSILLPDFNPGAHEYRIAGTRKGSVTQIIGEFIKVQLFGGVFYVHITDGVAIPEEVMLEAQDFGKAIHKGAYHLLSGHPLKWDALHPSLVPTLQQLLLWTRKYNPKVVLCETPLYSKRYDFAGTPDFIGHLQGIKQLCLVDIKTGLYGMAGPQTAAYEVLFREYSGYRGIIKRFVLHLPKDGTDYSFIPLTRRDDFTFFQYRKAQYDWLQKAA